MKPPPSWLHLNNYLSKAPFPHTITLGVGVSTYKFIDDGVYSIPTECISGSNLQTYTGFGRLGAKNLLLLQKHSEKLFAYNQVLMGKCEDQLFLWATQELGGFFYPFLGQKVSGWDFTSLFSVMTGVKRQSSILQKVRALPAVESTVRCMTTWG